MNKKPIFVSLQTAYNKKTIEREEGVKDVPPVEWGKLAQNKTLFSGFIDEHLFDFFDSGYDKKIIGKNGQSLEIAKVIEEKREKYKKMLVHHSVCPELCDIVSISIGGWQDNSDTFRITNYINHESQVLNPVLFPDSNIPKDIAILKYFWEKVVNSPCVVGYNLGGFTMPIMKAKTGMLTLKEREKWGIKHEWLDTAPWKNRMIDLQLVRFGYKYRKSLDWVADKLGIESFVASHITGDMIPLLYKNGDVDKVVLYAKSRLLLSVEVFRRWNGLYFPRYNLVFNKLEEYKSQIFNSLPKDVQDRLWEEKE